ncbi:hypothetical protein [Labilithrix luteola]|uniref:hypothetical protein n=1 Tax=Labilithrix luteola TaxID=1391654 RepID=UPI0011BAC66B|nr:hypothetical protein [Labilithrix luteola]
MTRIFTRSEWARHGSPSLSLVEKMSSVGKHAFFPPVVSSAKHFHGETQSALVLHESSVHVFVPPLDDASDPPPSLVPPSLGDDEHSAPRVISAELLHE